jgi:hypothetical protein
MTTVLVFFFFDGASEVVAALPAATIRAIAYEPELETRYEPERVLPYEGERFATIQE